MFIPDSICVRVAGTCIISLSLAAGVCPDNPESFLTQQYRWCARVNVTAHLKEILGYENALESTDMLYVRILLLYVHGHCDARQSADPFPPSYSHSGPHRIV